MIDNKDVDYIRNDLKKTAADQLSRGLISEAGADLIHRVVDATATNDDGITVGQIRMPLHDGVSLKRLFVIIGEEGQHILYVPEQPQSPGDRIFYENHDLTRTAYVLVGFLGKPGGLDYILDLIPEGQGDSAKSYFEELSRLPSAWRNGAMIVASVPGETYAHQIQAIVNR